MTSGLSPIALTWQGALSLQYTGSGGIAGRTKLSFWVYVGVAGVNGRDAKVPDITVGISGTKVRRMGGHSQAIGLSCLSGDGIAACCVFARSVVNQC
jgi:hypothetical protein